MIHPDRYLVIGAYGHNFGEFKTRREARAKCNEAAGDRIVRARLVPIGRASAEAFRIAQSSN